MDHAVRTVAGIAGDGLAVDIHQAASGKWHATLRDTDAGATYTVVICATEAKAEQIAREMLGVA